jgi:hypothetical protein
MRLEVLGHLENAMTPSGIKPATFRLVVQCLNQLRYRAPLTIFVYRFLLCLPIQRNASTHFRDRLFPGYILSVKIWSR